MRPNAIAFLGLQGLLLLVFLNMYGCASRQGDFKQPDRELLRLIKQQTEEQAQTRARQNQEIVSLREQDIPSLRGDIDKAIHRTQSLEARQDQLMAKLQQLLASTSPSNTNRPQANSSQVTNSAGMEKCEAKLDQHDELISSLLVQVQELSKVVREMRGRTEMGNRQ